VAVGQAKRGRERPARPHYSHRGPLRNARLCPPLQGFSPALFPLFPNGDPRVNVTGPYGRAVTTVRSPRVAEVARSHFGCPTLAGALLEDEGAGGSTGAHWEARLYQGELMLASAPFAGPWVAGGS
jgi:hypothetical protein